MSRRIDGRRIRVRELRDEGLSLRQIARRLGVHRSTVERDLLVPVPERGQLVPNAAGPGNERAVKSGVYSERRLGPVREEHARSLSERYPWIDPSRRALQAQRLAQVDLAAQWLDEQGGVVRDAEGRIYDVSDKLARWLGQAEAWFDRAEAERAVRGKYDALAEYLSDDVEVSTNG